MIALGIIGGFCAGVFFARILASHDNTPDDLPYGDETRLPDEARAAFERECG